MPNITEEKKQHIPPKTGNYALETGSFRELNQEFELLSLVASKTDNSIIIMDAEGNFEWVNQGFEQFNAMRFENFIRLRGRNIRQNSNNDNIDEIIDEILKSRKPKFYIGKFLNKKGKTIWYQTTISPVMDETGMLVRLIAIDTDITHLKEAEDQIRKQNLEIAKQRDELKKLNASKDKIFSIIAHDLKNPFHSIIGFSDLLLHNFYEIEDSRKKIFLNLIKNSSTSAYALLENLLNWARCQTNQIKFDPVMVNLLDLVKHNVELLDIIAHDKGINLIVNIPENLRVKADFNMLNTIIRNLLNNALKFTPAHGTVNIWATKSIDCALIKVADTGIGMDESIISKLFKLNTFFSTKGTSGESGTGLGLIICKEFVIRHGSELKIDSELEHGSTFSFNLPLA